MKYKSVQQRLRFFASTERAAKAKRFFKTNKGQYAEDDIFIGVRVPDIHMIAKDYYRSASLVDIAELLLSQIHEERFLALSILCMQFAADKAARQQIFDFYIDNRYIQQINNWDLVDASCYKIVGMHLLTYPEQTGVLHDFSQSKNIWIKRISIVSTLAFIKQNIFSDTMAIAKTLIRDRHDLIHRAVGWMLREIGKKNKSVLIAFLEENAHMMSRTSLGYATEKMSKEEIVLFRSLRT